MNDKPKFNKNAHTPNTKFGMGDYYGTGIKNKMGRSIDIMGLSPTNPKKMKKPPKSLA